jgi:hypothetical protein
MSIGSLRDTLRRPTFAALPGRPGFWGTFTVSMGSACKMLLNFISFSTLKDENPGKKFHFPDEIKRFPAAV